MKYYCIGYCIGYRRIIAKDIVFNKFESQFFLHIFEFYSLFCCTKNSSILYFLCFFQLYNGSTPPPRTVLVSHSLTKPKLVQKLIKCGSYLVQLLKVVKTLLTFHIKAVYDEWYNICTQIFPFQILNKYELHTSFILSLNFSKSISRYICF